MVVKQAIASPVGLYLKSLMTKRCKRCGRLLNISCFTKVTKYRDGLDCNCRECQKNAKIVGIYRIISPSGKVYIGQTWNLKNRFSIYKNFEKWTRRQPKLYHSLNKYGYNGHHFELIHELPKDVTQDVLNDYEIFYFF